MNSVSLFLGTVLATMGAAVALAEESSELIPRCGQTAFVLCGFVDAEASKNQKYIFVIEPKYEITKAFSEGLAAVRIEGEFGYIDVSGKLVIAPQFDQAFEFDQGLAVAGENGSVGIINRFGDYVVEPKFAHAKIFSDQIVLATSTHDDEKKYRESTKYALNDAGLFSLSEGWLTEEKYSFRRFGDPDIGVLWAKVPKGKPGRWDDEYGLMRIDGTWMIEPRFNRVRALEHNRAIVSKGPPGNRNYGAVDKDGREAIPFAFKSISPYNDNFLLAGQGHVSSVQDVSTKREGLINFDGELLGNRYFSNVMRPERGTGSGYPPQDFFTVRDSGVWKTLLKDGRVVKDQRIGETYLECEHFKIIHEDQAYVLAPNDISLPRVRFNWPLFAYNKKRCDPPPVLIFGPTASRYATNLHNGAPITETGKMFGGFFGISRSFFGTHRWVRVDNKWGLVGEDGDFAIDPVYTSIEAERRISDRDNRPTQETDTTYKVIHNEAAYRLSFVDGKYKQVPFTPLQIDTRKVLECRTGFIRGKTGLKRKSKNGLWGLVDENGDDVIPPQYRAIDCFSRGVAWVPDEANRQWCPVDRNNKMRSGSACKTVYYSNWMSTKNVEKFDDDPYESSVLWMRAYLDYGEGRREKEPGR